MAFNLSTGEAETEGSMCVQGQPTYTETPSPKQKKANKENEKEKN